MLSAGTRSEGRHRRRGGASTASTGKADSPLFHLTQSAKRGGSNKRQPAAATPVAASNGPTTLRTAIELGSVIAFLLIAPSLFSSGSKNTEAGGKMGSSANADTGTDTATGGNNDGAGMLESHLRRNENAVSRVINTADKKHPPRHPQSSVLLLGLVKDLRDVIGEGGRATELGGIDIGGGGGVLGSMEEICALYSTERISDKSRSGNGSVGIWITYAQEGDASTSADPEHDNKEKSSPSSVDVIRKRLEQSGCSEIILEREDEATKRTPKNENAKALDGEMSRYERLAMLRSQQRRRVIDRLGSEEAAGDDDRPRYDVVANIDFDLLSLPILDEFMSAAEAVASVEARGKNDADVDQQSRSHHSSLVVCANGYETWFNPEHGPKLYYDTLPAIDDQGNWYYQTYSRNPFRVATFGQGRLYESIKAYTGDTSTTLRNHPLWPMQACFGGVAMYGWDAFSSSHCDYVRSEISLPSQHADEEPQQQQQWQFPKRYTFSGTADGDACEHAVFQLCLAEEYQQRRILHNDDSSLAVGIQPGLIVSREANLMSTDDAMTALRRGIALGLGLVLIGAKIAYDRRRKDKSLSHKR